MTKPGDEVLTFAPYFPEYGPYVEGTGAVLKVVPPQAPAFQPNLDAFEEMLTENVTCVLINTPNNPTGVVYSAETLSRLADILTEKSKAFATTSSSSATSPTVTSPSTAKRCRIRQRSTPTP
mgnify:CR=1 FL=1